MSINNIIRNFIIPPKQYNSYILNVLGAQPIRILINHFFWHLRFFKMNKQYSEIIDQLTEYGFVKIENFLSAADFNSVKNEFYTSYNSDNLDIRNRISGKCLIEEIDVLEKGQTKYPATRKLYLMSERIRNIISAVTRRPIRLPPACILQRLSLESFDNKKNVLIHSNELFDTEMILHQDASLPVYKAWLYIDDVISEDGALIYAPKSQKITYERLKYEYKRSINLIRLNKGLTEKIPTGNIYKNRYVPSAIDRENLAIKEVSMTGKANTLIIANTAGLHCRGELQIGHVRKLLHLEFKRILSPLNWIPYINRLSQLDQLIMRNRRSEKYMQ